MKKMFEKGDSANFPGEETKKTGSSSKGCSSKDQSSIKTNKKTFLYRKTLTDDDVTKFKIMIPLESGKKFLAKPEKIDGKYRRITILLMDHDQQIWPMEVTFEELSSSYVLSLNWDNYFQTYGLEAGDVIFLYLDPEVPSFGHFLIEYEKKGAIDPPASAVSGNQGNLRPLMEKKPRNQDDTDSSSGSVPASFHDQDSNAKQGDGSEEAASTNVPTARVMDDNLSPILTEDKPRNKADTDRSSGSVPVSIDDEDSQTKKMGSLSSSSASRSSEASISGGSSERKLLYKKSLTYADVNFGRLMIPLESATEFLPVPEKRNGRYERINLSVLDHKREMWKIGATFDEMNNSYMLWWNWCKFVKKHGLKPEDVIFLYDDVSLQSWCIEYVKRLPEDSLKPYKKRSLLRV